MARFIGRDCSGRRSLGLGRGAVESGKKKISKNRDDRDHDEEFNQPEAIHGLAKT